MISRTGYTGELGFEVWCHPQDALSVWDAIWEAGQPHGLMPLGLDALDMVRIEAGLVFAGYEFCDQTDPFEAGIGFTVPLKTKEDDFVGKSTLINTVTNSKSKIGSYAFTTLEPKLGVMENELRTITIADLPGIIDGAAEGQGLGIKFLKHIERCKSLLHLIDITENDLEASYNQVRTELGEYSNDLLKKEELIVLNKIDLLDDLEVKEKFQNFKNKVKKNVMIMSTLNKDTLSNVKAKLLNYVS